MTKVCPSPATQEGIVSTRNVPPGSSGNPFGAASGGLVSGVMPDAAAAGALKLSPPSPDVTNMMSDPATQET